MPSVLNTSSFPSSVPIRPRVTCEFYVNGISQGIAYELVETPLPPPVDVLADVDMKTLTIFQKFAMSQKHATRKSIPTGYKNYYPAISLYGPASVSFNPGPNFKHTMPNGAQAYSTLGREIPRKVQNAMKKREEDVKKLNIAKGVDTEKKLKLK